MGPVFVGAILAFGASPSPVQTADLVPQGLSGLLFPFDPSLVLFSAGALGGAAVA